MESITFRKSVALGSSLDSMCLTKLTLIFSFTPSLGKICPFDANIILLNLCDLDASLYIAYDQKSSAPTNELKL
jgi:hypothetical protein